MGSRSDGMQLNPNHVATEAEEGPISFGRRIRQLAASRGDQVGLILASESGEEQVFSWREIDRRSTQVGRLLASHGLRADATVAVGLPNSPQHVFVTLGAWKLGACVLPIRWDLPAWERRRLLDVARASLVVADWEDCDPAGPIQPAADRGRIPLLRTVGGPRRYCGRRHRHWRLNRHAKGCCHAVSWRDHSRTIATAFVWLDGL